MTKTFNYSVAVHWCRMPPDEYLRANLEPDNKYLEVMVGGTPWYRLLPKTCNCRKTITREEADIWVREGTAQPIWASGRKGIQLDELAIWVVQKIQVCRVDLISKTDIERAYVDHLKEYIEYIEEVHEMYMRNRNELIVPFREDPCDGRILFPFASDDRTSGGVSDRRDRLRQLVNRRINDRDVS